MFGPIEGRRHDAFMLGVSGLSAKLQRFVQPNGEPYAIYGDPAYGITQNIISPFRQAHLTDDEQEFNTRMSKVRTCVEWGFGKICKNFAYLDFKRNLKILLQPVGKYYLVACILINCHTCLYGSQTTTYFNLEPPSLETYLPNQWPCSLGLSTYSYFSCCFLPEVVLYVNSNRSKIKQEKVNLLFSFPPVNTNMFKGCQYGKTKAWA